MSCGNKVNGLCCPADEDNDKPFCTVDWSKKAPDNGGEYSDKYGLRLNCVDNHCQPCGLPNAACCKSETEGHGVCGYRALCDDATNTCGPADQCGGEGQPACQLPPYPSKDPKQPACLTEATCNPWQECKDYKCQDIQAATRVACDTARDPSAKSLCSMYWAEPLDPKFCKDAGYGNPVIKAGCLLEDRKMCEDSYDHKHLTNPDRRNPHAMPHFCQIDNWCHMNDSYHNLISEALKPEGKKYGWGACEDNTCNFRCWNKTAATM